MGKLGSTRNNLKHSVWVNTGNGLLGWIFRVIVGLLGSVRVAVLNPYVPRGVTVWFELVFSQKNVWTDEIFIGSIWFGFHYFSTKKLYQTNRFGLVRLIGLLKNTIKKNHILIKYFIELCILYFIFCFFMFSIFQTTFYNNLTQYFIHMIQDSFIHHSLKTMRCQIKMRESELVLDF